MMTSNKRCVKEKGIAFQTSPFHFAPFGFTALTVLRNLFLKNFGEKKIFYSLQPSLLFKKPYRCPTEHLTVGYGHNLEGRNTKGKFEKGLWRL